MKFIKCYEKCSEIQRVTRLQNFGTMFTRKTRQNLSTSHCSVEM